MTASNGTFTALCQLLEPFNAAKIMLKPETDISADLNIDSVSVMDFVMEVEDHFDIDIPLNVLSETRSIADLVKVVDERLAKGGSA
jgi:acyl carrier protein